MSRHPVAPRPAGPFRHRRGRATQPGKTAPRQPPVEIAFLTDYGVPIEALNYAASLARSQGVSADAALLAEGIVAEDHFYRALADHLRVAFMEGEIDLAPGTGGGASGYARLRGSPGGIHWLFAPRGPEILRLMSAVRAANGRPLFALTTRKRYTEALRRAGASHVSRAASLSVERVDPDLCVRGALRVAPLAVATLVLAALLASLFSPSEYARLGASLILAGVFLANVCLRLWACAASCKDEVEPDWIDDARLPVYTVVIALYREAAVARQLARAIDRLDYPRAKLDVKFVVERDDETTAAALRAHAPRAPHEIIVAPEGVPRTKPRALNIATPHARGALIAVFDAEDLPEARQLRKAAAIFASAPDTLACLQASLVIDNGGLNWMTGLFALDYVALFDVYNRGLARLRLPFFLGGTSNHFRVEALQEVGFWDAYNVTEDADLGLRFARAGFEIRTFNSHTFEEAPATFKALVKQRTRWLKGWMQTGLVHCRRPLRLFSELGARGALAVLAMLAGGVLGPLLGPVLAGKLACDALSGALLAPAAVLGTAGGALWGLLAALGALALVLPLAMGARRRDVAAHPAVILFLPLWLLMLTLASWRALFDLWRRPFHWEKTEHGLTRRGHPDAVSGEEPLLEQEAGA